MLDRKIRYRHLADIVSREVRSRMMAGIRGKDTKPEMVIRLGLHQRGFRYRLHDKTLPGKPDLVFPKHRAAVFVNGCFWHGHDCPMFKLPSTRTDFWRAKLAKNAQNDAIARNTLLGNGWRVGEVWECALRGKRRLPEAQAIQIIACWLGSAEQTIIVRGL